MEMGAIIANSIAILSLLLSLTLGVVYFLDRRHARFQVESNYTEALLNWHSEVVRVLVSLRMNFSSYGSNERGSELASLSALIEQGRFFFPNLDRGDNYGIEKPYAYRGYRNLALDFLVASHKLFQCEPYEELMPQAEMLQRHFTSIVFEIVKPKHRLETIETLTDRPFVKDKCFEDFLNENGDSLIHYMWR